MNRRFQLWEISDALVRVAQGREPADLVIRNGRLVNVFTGEILPGTDVAVKSGRIALVGDASGTVGENTRVFDAGGRYLTPGFIDAHIHVESSMMTVCEYAKSVLPHGTSAIFMDPHEIVNVTGLEGMRAMMRDGAATPLRVYCTTPSCVPASPGLENTGSVLSPGDIEQTFGWEGVAGLGEMMDYFGLLAGTGDAAEKVNATLRAGKAVTGHFPLPDTGALLNAYAAAGVGSCHESTRAGEALAKLRLGMYAMLREGSAWDDLPEVIRAVTENQIDTRRVVLVSDDLHADTILERGHMDAIIRLAIRSGVRPAVAVQMATLNAACCFGLSGNIGSVAPGRFADINVLGSLTDVRVEAVFAGGELVAENGALSVTVEGSPYPEALRHTMRLPRQLTPEDFAVRAPAGAGDEVSVRVIGANAGNVLTDALIERLPVRDGLVCAAPERDICKVAVFNRHATAAPREGAAVGFAKGFGLKKGAAASTYAHDAHNLIVLGTNEADMAFAANRLIRSEGGIAAAADGSELALLPLPIAGLMSDRPAAEVAAALRRIQDAWKELGSPLPSPFMTMSLLSLSVIPSLRITDKGLVSVAENRLIPLFPD